MSKEKVCEALRFLQDFKHSSRTNIAEKRMTNRDAIAYVLATCGVLHIKTIRDCMMMWRINKVVYRERTECSYHKTKFGGNIVLNKRVNRPEFSFQSYFALQYGNVGVSFDSPEVKVKGWCAPGGLKSTLSIKPGTITHYWVQTKTVVPWWFRVCKGNYAIMANGLKRLREIGLM